MLTIVKGIGLLLLTLACFSVFSLKFPKGSEAMSGMANAAVASFLVEAVHHYITGDLLGIAFFSELGRILALKAHMGLHKKAKNEIVPPVEVMEQDRKSVV